MNLCRWLIVFMMSALPAGAALAQTAQETTKAQDNRPQDALGWLNWMAKAAAETTFAGIFIHQYGNNMTTSRVAHMVNPEGEHEKLETLDGAARELIRKNDEIICYLPDSKVIKLDRKRARRFFPALLTDVSAITGNYSAKLGGVERVAGYDCQVVMLEPKDGFRFGHRFCADLGSGLMLRATMFSEKREVLEQFAFTQLAMGSQVRPEQLRSSYTGEPGWQTDRSGLDDGRRVESGWHAESLPPGFKKILEVKRRMLGKSTPVIQQIYSDGLAAVSVFIEGAEPGEKAKAGLIQQGHHNLYVRPLAEQPFSVKVLGEVPRASLQQIGNSLSAPGR